MSYIDDLNQAASEALAASSSATDSAQIMFDVANGGETTTVTTANGEVKSLAKAIKDIIDSIEAGVEAPQVEPQTLAAGQTTVTLATMTTEGIAVYVEGSREFDFTITNSTDFEFGQSFPDGTRIWIVNRDIEGTADSFTVNTSTGTQTLVNALEDRGAVFDSVADLNAATNLQIGQKVRTLGYYAPGGGGGNDYEIVAAATGTDDGGSFIDLTGSGLQAKGLFSDGFLYVESFGARGDGASNDTPAVQACVDFSISSGKRVVYFSASEYRLESSTLGETYFNGGVSVDSSGACIVIKDGVALVGQGRGRTVLTSSDPEDSILFVVDGNDTSVSEMSLTANWSGSGAGHGIFQVSSTTSEDNPVSGLLFENLYISDVGSYGIGIQNGLINGLTISNVHINKCGADGIDLKNRGTTPENKSILIENVIVENHGLRTSLVQQAGVDIRGVCTLNNIFVLGVGGTDTATHGIRLRTLLSDSDRSASFTSLSNFYVSGVRIFDLETTTGVSCGSPNCVISNGTIEGTHDGVSLGGNANGTPDNCTVSAVVDSGANVGFVSTGSVLHTKFVGCQAVDCDTGFRAEGENVGFIGCGGKNNTNNISITSSAVGSVFVVGGSLYQDYMTFNMPVAGRAALEAKGGSTDIDIAIVPKGTGRLRFGSHSAIGSETVTGFIEIRDNLGTIRKVAIVS